LELFELLQYTGGEQIIFTAYKSFKRIDSYNGIKDELQHFPLQRIVWTLPANNLGAYD